MVIKEIRCTLFSSVWSGGFLLLCVGVFLVKVFQAYLAREREREKKPTEQTSQSNIKKKQKKERHLTDNRTTEREAHSDRNRFFLEGFSLSCRP